MGQFKTDLIIFIGLLILASVIFLLTDGQSTLDIQLHDTYFVLDKFSIAVLITGPLMFLIFLARGLTWKFKKPGSNIGLIIGLMLVAFITYSIIKLQQNYLDEVMRLDDDGLPDAGQFVARLKSKINWTWGLFGIWVIGILLLTFRTIRILKEKYGNQNGS